MGRPWMPLYVADYILDTRDLTLEQHGVFLLLLMLAWRRPGGALPDDMGWIRSNLPPMHGHAFNRLVPPLLERFFERDADGQFTNKRLANELQKADKLSANQKQKADKRWSETKENNNIADAAAMPSQSQSQSQSQEQRKKETREEALLLAEQFEDFWKIYPNKVGKRAAEKSFRAALKRASAAEIMDGAWNYIRDKPPDRAWLNPTTFLNQNRWEDKPATVGVRNNGPPGNISSACDKLISILDAGFGRAPPEEQAGGGTDEADVRLLSYGRG